MANCQMNQQVNAGPERRRRLLDRPVDVPYRIHALYVHGEINGRLRQNIVAEGSRPGSMRESKFNTRRSLLACLFFSSSGRAT